MLQYGHILKDRQTFNLLISASFLAMLSSLSLRLSSNSKSFPEKKTIAEASMKYNGLQSFK